MSRPIIEVRNLSKGYQLGTIGATRLKDEVERLWNRLLGRREPVMNGRFWALQDVSFEVQPGEVVGIIGRNGAGKSTLLKILSRITQQTRGEIVLRGRVASLLEVGTGFHPDLTGRENIFLNGAILGMTRVEIRRKLDEIIAFAEVEQFIDTPVKRYSSGMYVRLAFAVAAHLEPEILIVDEVLAVGDIEFQKKCLGKMRDFSSREGRTVLFVSHNLEAVRKLCSRGILLDRGQVLQTGSAESVITRYISSDSLLRTSFPIVAPPEKNAPAFASGLAVEDPEGSPANGFVIGNPWRVRVSFTVTRSMEHFIIAIGLVSDRGIGIWTTWSRPENLEPGNYDAVFFNDQVSLCAGSYSLTVGLSVNRRAIHYVEEAGVLVISEVSDGSDALNISGGAGFILNPLSVTILKHQPAI